MHPLVPFVSEELWQRVPRPASRKASIAFGPYPVPGVEMPARDQAVEAWMQTLQRVISEARTVRSEFDVDKKAEVPLRVQSENPELLAFLRGHHDAIRLLVKTAGDPVFEAPTDPVADLFEVAIATPQGGAKVLVGGVKGLGATFIQRRLNGVAKEIASLEKTLGAPGFADRAPAEVVAEKRSALAALHVVRQNLEAKLRFAESKQ